MEQQNVVELKKYLTENNISGLALDIDETICSTAEHWANKCLDELGNPENLTGLQIFEKYKLFQNVPYWDKKKVEKLLPKFRLDEDMHFDCRPIPNVLEYVNKLNNNSKTKIVAYITARNEMLEKITNEWLIKHNFPIAPVILKPDSIPYEQGNNWKAKVLQYLYPQVNSIVDDNPKLAKEICDTYKGKIYLLSYETHENEKHNVTACKDWEKVHLELFKNN